MRSDFTENKEWSFERAINELCMNRDIVQQTQILLRGYDSKGDELNVFDNVESPMLLGLKILLQTYLVLKQDKLTDDNIKQIKKMIVVLKDLEKRSYAKWADWSDPNELKSMKLQHCTDIETLLETKGEIYVPGGFKGHHSIYKYTKTIDPKTQKAEYFRTEFNAGEDAGRVNAQLVWGVNKRKIKDGLKTKLILKDVENFFSFNYWPNVEMLEATIISESQQVAQQTLSVGNCTVRSSYEMLREGFGNTSLFRDFFHFITKSKIDDLFLEMDFVARKDSKQSTPNKIGNYSQFIQAILSEAIHILKKSKLVITATSQQYLESMMIKALMADRSFSLSEIDLLKTSDIALKLAKTFIKRGLIKAQDNAIFVDVSAVREEKSLNTKYYRKDTYQMIINLVGKQLEAELGKPLTDDELFKLERYIHELVFFNQYKSCIYMHYHNLINLSYIVSQGFIDTHLVMIEGNALTFNDKHKSYDIKKNLERMKQMYFTLTHVTNSSLGKDLALSIAASDAFNELSLAKHYSEEEQHQIILYLKYILEDYFPGSKITNAAVDIAKQCLMKLIQTIPISDLKMLYEQSSLIQKKLTTAVTTFLVQKDDKIKDQIKFSLFKKDKKISKVNLQAAELITAIQAVAKTTGKGELSVHEILVILSILKTFIKDKSYNTLKSLKLSGQFFEETIIKIVLKKANRKNLDKMQEKLKFAIQRYQLELDRVCESLEYVFMDESLDNVERLIKAKLLSKYQINIVLLKALKINDTSLARLILDEKDIDVNYHEDKNTALAYAIYHGNEFLVDLLLKRGADCYAKTSNGFTPLMYAFQQIEIFDESDSSKRLARENIKKLIEQRVGNKHLQELFFALCKGERSFSIDQVEMIQKFIGWKIEVNASDNFGNTPLIWAAWKKQTKVVKVLLENKVDVNKVNSFSGKSALKNAYESASGDIEIIKMLLEAGASDGLDILCLAILEKNYTIAINIIHLKLLNLDAKDSLGNTPLSYASFLNDSFISKELQKFATKLPQPLKSWEDIFINAVKRKNKSLVELLLSKRLGLKFVKDGEGRGVTTIAYEDNNMELMEYFVARKIFGYEEIFFRAVKEGNIAVVENFLNWSVNTETADNFNNTSLIYAAYEGRIEIVRLLINRGANINHKGAENKTPLMNAYAKGHVDIIEVLVKAKCLDAEEILALAKTEGKTEIVTLMQKLGVTESKPQFRNPP